MFPLKKLDHVFHENGHIHYLNGEMVTGVSSVTKLYPKGDSLVGWAAKVTSEAIAGLWKPAVAYSRLQIDQICKGAKGAWRNSRDNAADKGTETHSRIDYWVKLRIEPLINDPDVLRCFNKFREWEKLNKVVWLCTELKVASEKYKFAGIFDGLAYVNGILTLIDFKTSSGIYIDYYIQTAGYQLALEEMALEPLPFMQRMILWVPKTGKDFEARIVPTSYEMDRTMFLIMLPFAKMVKDYERFEKNYKEIQEQVKAAQSSQRYSGTQIIGYEDEFLPVVK